jgi:hypothetical protein
LSDLSRTALAAALDLEPLDARRRYELTLRHKLAMESIGLIRTALHVQRPALERLIAAKDQLVGDMITDNAGPALMLRSQSLALQIRMAKLALAFLHDLDAIADEVVHLAAKEKANA